MAGIHELAGILRMESEFWERLRGLGIGLKQARIDRDLSLSNEAVLLVFAK